MALAAALGVFVGPAMAGEADVVGAKGTETAPGVWRFDVSIVHADEGWDLYSDKFDILDTEGNILGTRILVHPHVNEQPFTRSLSGVEIPSGITTVVARAHDSVHLYGGIELTVILTP
ncbi:MAG: hypothetical protein GXP01_04185 [Alphaproteobacteria bacterium]|nr:hypothetical protein [Alphaproteobacteria bacterium]